MKTMRPSFQTSYLIGFLEKIFKTVPSDRSQSPYSLSDCFLSAFALFHLKFPSLLAFDETYKAEEGTLRHNLKMLYRVEQAPSDTTLRERLDGQSISILRECFRALIGLLQKEKVLNDWTFMGHKLVSLDGTGFFSSSTIHCDECCVKESKTKGKTYYHQMLVGCIVHPFQKYVFPVLYEPICKKDGDVKNDCERNAAKRFLKKYREDYPNMPTIILEDGLSSNAPHIKELQASRCKFILGVKEGDHAFLTQWFWDADQEDAQDWKETSFDKECRYRYMENVPLNETHFDLRVNVIFYEEKNLETEKTTKWMWVTDLVPTREKMPQLVLAGRARWKIENETFNTLKNQGYAYEHNFGHGYKTLSNLFAGLMLLAFAVDQILFATDQTVQACLKKMKRFCRLWEMSQGLFRVFHIMNWDAFYKAILAPPRIEIA